MPKKSSLIYEPEQCLSLKNSVKVKPKPKNPSQSEIARKLQIKKIDLATLVIILC